MMPLLAAILGTLLGLATVEARRREAWLLTGAVVLAATGIVIAMHLALSGTAMLERTMFVTGYVVVYTQSSLRPRGSAQST